MEPFNQNSPRLPEKTTRKGGFRVMGSIEVSQDLSIAQDRATVNLTVSLPREVYDFFVEKFGWEDYFIYSLLDVMLADLDATFSEHPRCKELKEILREAQEHIPKGSWYR
jgi:hypothetical protein